MKQSLAFSLFLLLFSSEFINCALLPMEDGALLARNEESKSIWSLGIGFANRVGLNTEYIFGRYAYKRRISKLDCALNLYYMPIDGVGISGSFKTGTNRKGYDLAINEEIGIFAGLAGGYAAFLGSSAIISRKYDDRTVFTGLRYVFPANMAGTFLGIKLKTGRIIELEFLKYILEEGIQINIGIGH